MKRYPFYFLLIVLLFITVTVGCWSKNEPVVLNLYCSETFWHVMQEETKAFQQIYGIRTVVIPISLPKQNNPPSSDQQSSDTSVQTPPQWKNRPKNQNYSQTDQVVLDPAIASLIEELSNNRSGDIYITDSTLEIDCLKSFLLTTYEYPFCFLTMTLCVPKNNPQQIYSVHDVFEKRLQLGIARPSKNGSGLVAQDILSGFTEDSKKDHHIQEELVQQFESQYDLLEALEKEEIDAALVWDAVNLRTYLHTKYADEYYKRYEKRFDKAKQKWNIDEIAKLIEEMNKELYTEKIFAEKIILPGTSLSDKKSEEQTEPVRKEHRVIQVALISLNTTLYDKHVRRFSDFLISNQGKKILKKHGFTPNHL
jgi:ABC-type molybdate transport system substrate-binding protein